MSTLEERAREADAAASREMVRRGRILVWSAILPWALLEAALFALALSQALSMRTVSTIVRVALDVTLVWMTINGSPGARRLLAFFCGLGLVVSLAMLVDANALKAAFLGVTSVECAFALWVFTFSTAAREYIDAHGHVTNR
jgi:hypothetical protein